MKLLARISIALIVGVTLGSAANATVVSAVSLTNAALRISMSSLSGGCGSFQSAVNVFAEASSPGNLLTSYAQPSCSEDSGGLVLDLGDVSLDARAEHPTFVGETIQEFGDVSLSHSLTAEFIVTEWSTISLTWSGDFVVSASTDGVFDQFPLNDPYVGGQQRARASAYSEVTVGSEIASKLYGATDFSSCLGGSHICDPQDPSAKSGSSSGSLFQQYQFVLSPGTYLFRGFTSLQVFASNVVSVPEPATLALLFFGIGALTLARRHSTWMNHPSTKRR